MATYEDGCAKRHLSLTDQDDMVLNIWFSRLEIIIVLSNSLFSRSEQRKIFNNNNEKRNVARWYVAWMPRHLGVNVFVKKYVLKKCE